MSLLDNNELYEVTYLNGNKDIVTGAEAQELLDAGSILETRPSGNAVTLSDLWGDDYEEVQNEYGDETSFA